MLDILQYFILDVECVILLIEGSGVPVLVSPGGDLPHEEITHSHPVVDGNPQRLHVGQDHGGCTLVYCTTLIKED